MELKKSPTSDLESKKGIFLLIGLIIALSGTIIAMESKWDNEESDDDDISLRNQDETELDIEITRPEPPPPPKEKPPPPPELPEEIEILEDDKDIDKDFIMDDVETDQEEMIEEEEEEFQEIYTFASVMPLLGDCKDEICTQTEIIKFIFKSFKYPEIAKANGIEGRVVVTFVVGKDGKVGSVELAKDGDGKVIGSSGNKHLDKAAIEAVKKFNSKNAPKFTPARNVNPENPRGKKVKLKYTVPVKCTLG